MRAVRFHEYGGPEVLQVESVERPEATGHSVVVEVAGAGVNPVDTYFREGSYEPFTLPMIPGVDVAGTVAETSEYVDSVEEGDPVVATGLGNDRYGGYAEYVAVPESRLAVLPSDADLVAAGGMGVAGVTAFRALVDHAGLEPAETCLIHGGSGGVGHAAVQIAAAAGGHVVTTAAPEYHDAVETLGADVVLDYGRDDLTAAVDEASLGDGVDVILDHRLDDYLQFDAEVAATGARLVGIGENDPSVGFSQSSAARGKDLQATFMSMFNTPRLADPLDRLAALVDAGDVEVSVAETYDLEEAADAQQDVMDESFLGKLVLTP